MKNNTRPLFPLSHLDLILAGILGLLSLALYVRTLAPSVLYGDISEFQTLSYTLGMTHPSGYPTRSSLVSYSPSCPLEILLIAST